MRSPLLKKPVDFFSSSSCSSLTDVQCRNSHPQPIFLPPRPSSLSRSQLLGAEKQKALVPPSSVLYYIHVPWSPQDAVSSALPSTSWPWGRSSTSQHITAHRPPPAALHPMHRPHRDPRCSSTGAAWEKRMCESHFSFLWLRLED